MVKVKNALILFLVVFFCFQLFSCGSSEEKRAKYFNKGMRLYEKGDYVKARLEFRNVIQIDRNFAEGYYMLGMVAAKQQVWKGALGLFSKAVALDPNLITAQLELGKMQLLFGRVDEAGEKADLVLAKEPQNIEALVLKAGCFMAENRASEAEPLLRKVVDQAPENGEACRMLAEIMLQNGQADEAIQLVGKFLKRDEKNKDMRLFLAAVLEENNAEAAEEQYQTLIAQFPEDLDLKIDLVNLYIRLNKDQKAEKILLETVSKYPKEKKHRLILAEFYGLKQQPEKMTDVLEKTISDFPRYYDAYEVLARYYLAEGDGENAIKLLNRFMDQVRKSPNYLLAKVFKSSILFQEKKLDESFKLVEEVLKENPDDAKARTLKGDILTVKKDFEGAIAEYRAVLDQDPGDERIAAKLAQVHMLNQEPLLAKKIYEEILQKNPDMLVAANNLAFYYAEYEPDKDNLLKAEKLLTPLLEKYKDSPRILDTAAWVYYRQGRYAKARELLKRIEGKARDDPSIDYHLGMVYLKMGDSVKGKQKLKMAIDNGRPFPGKKQAQKVLVGLG